MSTVKPQYSVSIPVSCNVASLNFSTTFITGRESNIIDNTTSLYLDFLLSGKVRVGTTPAANSQILVYVYGRLRDAPTLPDVFTGSDANVSLTSAGVGRGALRLAQAIDVDGATSNRDYPFGPVGIAALFNGNVPDQFGLYVTHSTSATLNGSINAHFFSVTGLQLAIV